MATTKKSKLKEGVLLVLQFLAVLWIIHIINFSIEHFLQYKINNFGLVPRTKWGVLGVFSSPFLHGDWWHLIANSVPLLFLGSLTALRGKKIFISVSVTIAFISGIALWCVGRPASHIGASGLIFGYFGYLIGRAWFERTFGAIFIALITVFLYGGMIWGILPRNPNVSWEGHLCGLIAGILVAAADCRTKRPKQQA